jgi:hypothetical protein
MEDIHKNKKIHPIEVPNNKHNKGEHKLPWSSENHKHAIHTIRNTTGK